MPPQPRKALEKLEKQEKTFYFQFFCFKQKKPQYLTEVSLNIRVYVLELKSIDQKHRS